MNLSKVEWAIVETMVIIFDKDNGETGQIADLLIKCNNQFVLQKRYGIFACEKQTLQIIWYKGYNHNINRFYALRDCGMERNR